MGKEWTICVSRWGLHSCRPRRWLPRGTAIFHVACGDHVYSLCSEWWVGIWPVARRGRGNIASAPDGERKQLRRPTVKKKEAKARTADGAKHAAPVETKYFADLMPVVEHLAFTSYDDGDPREPGWITLKVLGAAWVCQVKDPDSGNSFQFVAESLDKALEGAALLLACDDAPWQPDAFLRKNKKR